MAQVRDMKAVAKVPKHKAGALAKFNPKDAKRRRAEAKAVIEYAKSIQDWPTLESAVTWRYYSGIRRGQWDYVLPIEYARAEVVHA